MKWISLIFLMGLAWALSGCQSADTDAPQVVPAVVIDADTGNEMDDLYAIVRGLLAEGGPVAGLTSAHFNNPQLLTDSLWHIYPTEGIQTMAISQQLNEVILTGMGRLDLPHPRGCDRMVGYAWGYYEGAPIPESPAVDFLIEQARRASPEAKLNVWVLGPATNLAAALRRAPELSTHVRAYLLGMRYDPQQQGWDKNEFNARNDLNALDLLLSDSALELIVMPANTAQALTFDHAEALQQLDRYDHPTAQLLRRRWAEVDAGASWVMWDLALVSAALHPEWAELETVPAPPENGRRSIGVYTAIDAAAMRRDFWRVLAAHWP
jgi:purine nucleosidase